jgi:hypothetical protein
MTIFTCHPALVENSNANCIVGIQIFYLLPDGYRVISNNVQISANYALKTIQALILFNFYIGWIYLLQPDPFYKIYRHYLEPCKI